MKTALVFSSLVSASRVGATASAFCLRRLGIETIVLPTTVLGRHPGWGSPGGQALDEEHIRSMWSTIKEQNIPIDGLITGYLAAESHIDIALDIIADVRAANSNAVIIVDPVMGDNGRLYIPQQHANAIKSRLVPQADIITPNAWEFSFITDCDVHSLKSIKNAACNLSVQSLVTSVLVENEIGALYTNEAQCALVRHKKFKTVPHGGGDALSATFLAHILNEMPPQESLARSVSSIFSILSSTKDNDAGELPLIRKQDALFNARPLAIQLLNDL